jgi:hypothetical protein
VVCAQHGLDEESFVAYVRSNLCRVSIREVIMRSMKQILVVAVLAVSACHSTEFESTWHDPSAGAVNLRHKTVAAFLISENESVRRSFELNLANQLTLRGIETLPGYEVLPNTPPTSKEEVLTKLRNTDTGVGLFMRIVDRHQEITFIPDVWYPGAYHDPYWWRDGTFYGPDFGGPWPPYYDSGYFQTDTIVSVETLAFSNPDSKLLFAGLSRTMNPSQVDKFVEELVSEAVKKLRKAGMLGAGVRS